MQHFVELEFSPLNLHVGVKNVQDMYGGYLDYFFHSEEPQRATKVKGSTFDCNLTKPKNYAHPI